MHTQSGSLIHLPTNTSLSFSSRVLGSLTKQSLRRTFLCTMYGGPIILEKPQWRSRTVRRGLESCRRVPYQNHLLSLMGQPSHPSLPRPLEHTSQGTVSPMLRKRPSLPLTSWHTGANASQVCLSVLDKGCHAGPGHSPLALMDSENSCETGPSCPFF